MYEFCYMKSDVCLQLHLAKLAKESIERSRNEDLKAMTKRVQMREEELNSYIEDIGDKHGSVLIKISLVSEEIVYELLWISDSNKQPELVFFKMSTFTL